MIIKLATIMALVIALCLDLFVQDSYCTGYPLLSVEVNAPASGTVKNYDYCDYPEWGSDCKAYAGQTSASGAAYGKVELNETGLIMGASTYSTYSIVGNPFSNANSRNNVTDKFTLNTKSGPSEAVFNAILNYTFDGELFLPQIASEISSAYITMTFSAYQLSGAAENIDLSFGAQDRYGEFTIHYDTLLPMASQSWTTISDPDDPLYGLYGRLYRWEEVPIGVPLEGFKADEIINVRIDLSSQTTGYGYGNFFNTFATDTNSPFAITSGPEGSSYNLTTLSSNNGFDVSLFGPLELNSTPLVAPIPIPSTILLMGSGLLGLLGVKLRKKS
ncbi:MAG: hypothetical protein GQ542_20990 [Desulforhopalus sp.]|nr:hypothetical protein [Desulforhopalus sp.]